MKHNFSLKIREGWQSRNGNGGSSYSISCIFYRLFVDEIEVKEFDRKWEVYEYINKEYFPKEWNKDKKKIKRLEKEIEDKQKLMLKIDKDMKSEIYAYENRTE
jgi:hypothetical protein